MSNTKSIAPALTYSHQNRLMLSINSENPSTLSIASRCQHALADIPVRDVSAADALQALQQAYQDGYEQHAANEFELQGIAIAGHGDPLLALATVTELMQRFKAIRHGVPVTLLSYGLVAPEQAESICQQLTDSGVEALEIFFPAANPPTYQTEVKPLIGDFSAVCHFITTAVSHELRVTALVPESAPAKSEIRQLAQALGATTKLV
ncbi:hydrolase TatD [Pseudidiomarina mangrovi]|uniref:hydrolase TatD n=1 Tax=Pseudidiomarina mangrovi TaxID=2487133 RepID=UPI000FC9BB50|nr:hydrolase TatD [Pseudidiomarina mangrovi]